MRLRVYIVKHDSHFHQNCCNLCNRIAIIEDPCDRHLLDDRNTCALYLSTALTDIYIITTSITHYPTETGQYKTWTLNWTVDWTLDLIMDWIFSKCGTICCKTKLIR